VTFARESVFEPAAWSVTDVVPGEIGALDRGVAVPPLPGHLAIDLELASAAPPDPPLVLVFKVLLTPPMVVVDACSGTLAFLFQGAAGGVAAQPEG
jgi:hypothetical protein